MLNLSEFDLQAEAERGATMHVLHPKTGERTSATCQVVGVEAKAYRDRLRAIRNEAMKNPDREPADEDGALLLGRARQAVAALTGWTDIGDGGETVEFNDESAIRVMTKFPWLADQVLGFASNRGNFGRG